MIRAILLCSVWFRRHCGAVVPRLQFMSFMGEERHREIQFFPVTRFRDFSQACEDTIEYGQPIETGRAIQFDVVAPR